MIAGAQVLRLISNNYMESAEKVYAAIEGLVDQG